jgi:hypothetical protein
MANAKVNVKALQAVSHGNVDMREGGVYAMNRGDANELARLGFVSLDGASGEPEQTQLDHQPQVKQKGDVVVDDADDLLGDTKAAPEVENKMEPAARNKSKK